MKCVGDHGVPSEGLLTVGKTTLSSHPRELYLPVSMENREGEHTGDAA